MCFIIRKLFCLLSGHIFIIFLRAVKFDDWTTQTTHNILLLRNAFKNTELVALILNFHNQESIHRTGNRGQ